MVMGLTPMSRIATSQAKSDHDYCIIFEAFADRFSVTINVIDSEEATHGAFKLSF